MFRTKKKAFTLIEMLIVVVIIGILAAALIPRLQSVQARARDTKRKADLHQIGTAFAIYKEDNGGYAGIKDNDNGGTPNGLGATWQGYDSWVLTSQEGIHTYYSDSDQLKGLNTILERYMTAIPLDSSLANGWSSNPGPEVHGYVVGVLPRRGTSFDSIVLAARTESDGSSSNWVTYNSSASDGVITGNGTNWIGSIGGYSCDTSLFRAQVYDDNVCSKVTFDSSTTNDGQGTCTADKNGDDLRYVYVQ